MSLHPYVRQHLKIARLHIADKEPVLAAEGDLAHQQLDTVVIDWNATVPCVHGQGFPVVANVTKGSSQIRFRKDLGLGQPKNDLGKVETADEFWL